MTKKFFSILTCLLLTLAVVTPPETAFAATILPITASSALLLDNNSNHLIYAKNVNEKRAPASTTKILTAMVAMDMLSLDTVVTIPKDAESIPPSKIFVRAGERYRVDDLLRATLIKSANDAATVLAIAAAGNEPSFAEMMNAKARSIGCRRSHFVHASGLPANDQYSTAYDMALIAKEAQKYDFIDRTLRIRTMTIASLDGRKIPLKNHNKMLWRDSREIVGKTGWTRTAKHCFVGQIGPQSRASFVSMLGSRSLWKDLKILVDYVFGKAFGVVKRPRSLSAVQNKEIQLALKKAGYDPGTADGVWGKSSKKALKRFQKAHGLKADGVAGPLTLEQLQKYQS
ncbi:MAG TPA: peptidoglycan-binding protein [Verrucomicrobiae bacterium]|nr:peptidoglycan-binding protein [Verrucomicrobiae bacterium]